MKNLIYSPVFSSFSFTCFRCFHLNKTIKMNRVSIKISPMPKQIQSIPLESVPYEIKEMHYINHKQ